MERRKYCYYLLGCAIAFASCMLSGCIQEMDTDSTQNRIMLTIEDDGFDVRTRGAKVTSITDFGISASVYDAASTYTSAGCGSYFFNESATAGTPTEHYWPTSDYKLSFFAYYPYGNSAFTVQSVASDLGAPTYAYTVPSAIGSQLDVMTGQTTNVLGGGSSPVLLTMKHRCAAVNFSVTNNRSSDITLNSISIEGVKYSGTLNEETWTLNAAVNSSSSNPFTLTYGNTVAVGATTNVTGTSDIFLMLPQTIPADAKVKVVVNGEPFETTLSGLWEAGKQYNYSIVINSQNINAVLSINNWAEGEIGDIYINNWSELY